jgi:Family of unknown function (DUF6188)
MTARLSSLRGASLERIERREHDWRLTFAPGGSLRTESLWRIVAGGRIALSSSDHLQRFGLGAPIDAQQEALNILGTATIAEALLDSDTGDLTLTFESGVRLQFVNASSGYEGWEAVTPDGYQVIAMGGGAIAVFPP